MVSKNHPRNQLYGRRWNLQGIYTAAGSKTIDENWVPGAPKIILETQLYDWS